MEFSRESLLKITLTLRQ